MFNTKYYNNLGTSFTEREIPVWNGELLGDIMQALVFRGNSVKLMYLNSPEKIQFTLFGIGEQLFARLETLTTVSSAKIQMILPDGYLYANSNFSLDQIPIQQK